MNDTKTKKKNLQNRAMRSGAEITNERGGITTNTREIQKSLENILKKIYANKLDKLEEVDKFLDPYNLSKLKLEEIGNLTDLLPARRLNQ